MQTTWIRVLFSPKCVKVYLKELFNDYWCMYLWNCSSHEALLSDEEAQEVERLLSPTPEKEKDEPEWLQDVLSAAGTDSR